MCGINDLIYKENLSPLEEIARINSSTIYRGPDDKILAFVNVLFNHVRLSIQDLSTKGRQPMSVDERYCIFFNGKFNLLN